jgi:hypothetical protein
MAVNQIFARTAQDDLPGHGDIRIFLETDGGFGGIPVIEDNGHAGFGHTGLTALVDKILQVLRTNSAHIRDTEDETDGVEDVRFTTAVKASDGVEGFIPIIEVISGLIAIDKRNLSIPTRESELG